MPKNEPYLVKAAFSLSEEDSHRLMKELGRMYPRLEAFLTDTKEAFSMLDACLLCKDGPDQLQKWLNSHTDKDRDAGTVVRMDPTRHESGVMRVVPMMTLRPSEGLIFHEIKVYRYSWTDAADSPKEIPVPHYSWWIDCDLNPSGSRARGLVNLIQEWLGQPIMPGTRLTKVSELAGSPLFIYRNRLCRYSKGDDGAYKLVPQMDPYISLEDLGGKRLRNLITASMRFNELHMLGLVKELAQACGLSTEGMEALTQAPSPELIEVMAKHYEDGDGFLIAPDEIYRFVEQSMDVAAKSEDMGDEERHLLSAMTEHLRAIARINLEKTIPSRSQMEDWIQALLQVAKEYHLSPYRLIKDGDMRDRVWKRFLPLTEPFIAYLVPRAEVMMGMFATLASGAITERRHPERLEDDVSAKKELDRLTELLSGNQQSVTLARATALWIRDEVSRIYCDGDQPRYRNRGKRRS